MCRCFNLGWITYCLFVYAFRCTSTLFVICFRNCGTATGNSRNAPFQKPQSFSEVLNNKLLIPHHLHIPYLSKLKLRLLAELFTHRPGYYDSVDQCFSRTTGDFKATPTARKTRSGGNRLKNFQDFWFWALKKVSQFAPWRPEMW